MTNKELARRIIVRGVEMTIGCVIMYLGIAAVCLFCSTVLRLLGVA